jgi:predicted RNase H-like nuclease
MGGLAGVDGCRAGWVIALAPAGDLSAPILHVVASFAEALVLAGEGATVAVDMPVGLPERIEGPGRMPERLVRPLLGARQSSVFSIPARAAVQAPDYAAACALAAALSDPPRKVSKQGFMIFPRIREIDLMLRTDPALAERVFESHPEVVFQALQRGRPLDLPKKVKSRPFPPGLDLRRGLLARAGVGEAALTAPPPRGAGADDLLDALACLVCAAAIARGQATSYPTPPLRDAHGLPVAIWAPIAHKHAD